MRRKSERTATKKTKSSPDKKVEKAKRTRTRRRKQSTSSDNESGDEAVAVQKEVVTEIENNPPQTPVKEASPEDAHDQVWQVKTAESSGDVGEIKKLKICLTRPPSTPERVDRSPRSKRKHSRATSSSDTPSVEGVDEKRKSKHRSKRLTCDSQDDADKNHDSQEDQDAEPESHERSSNEISQSTTEESISDETPMSTTNDEDKTNIDSQEVITKIQQKPQENSTNDDDTKSDADTTVASPKVETTVVSTNSDVSESKVSASETHIDPQSESIDDKSEILELHPDESKNESLDASQPDCDINNQDGDHGEENISSEIKVSKNEDEKSDNSNEMQSFVSKSNKSTDKNDVVVSPEKISEVSEALPIETDKDSSKSNNVKENKSFDRNDSTQPEDTTTPPLVINRKRRWGSRPAKLNSQKSITISSDVLKDIIPDVKPVEFDEVIEDKKNKREVTEKVERPILPKIVIDNSENVENNKKLDIKDSVKPKAAHISSNRKISIVKETDSIIARPPSPPRHKQSNILFITHLVRPFTLPQLKNLLQRTGRIAEEGFWIDRIKSKCFVKYETEDQAVETRHALHGVTWPVSNPKTLQVDFSNEEAFEKAKANEDIDNAQVSTIPGTVEDWLREQDMKRERGEMEKPFEKKAVREWDMGKNDKDKDIKDKSRRLDDRPQDKRRHRSIERSPEPARKFKKKEEEAPAKLLDDLFRKTKTTPCIYWLPLSAETIAIKEEQRRQHMAEHERRLLDIRRTHRRH